MRRLGMLLIAAAVGFGVQFGGQVSAVPAVTSGAITTTITGWWPTDPVAVQPWGVVSVPVRVQTGSEYVTRQVQVQRRKAGAATWGPVYTAATGPDGRFTARLSAAAGLWQFRLVVLASTTADAKETVARTVTVLRAETISAGERHSCGLDTNGAAWCWGLDLNGQLGDGPANQGAKYGPVRVAGGHTFSTIAAGIQHTCAVDTAGKAWCWGYDFFGEVGDGNLNRANKYAPVAVAGNFKFTTITADAPTCALTTTGKAWCWGPDGYGQVGDGPVSQGPKHAPVAVWGGRQFADIDMGDRHTCAVDINRRAWCWGQGTLGQLGIDSSSSSTVPVAVIGGKSFTAISAGGRHTCGLGTDGKAWCWGLDEYGQIGNGDPVEYESGPLAVVGNHRFTDLTAGMNHTCGTATDGQAWCWGSDEWGQLGNGPIDRGGRNAPVAVVGGISFAMVSVGREHSCGVDRSGVAWCWGHDSDGQVGDSNADQRATVPAPVTVVRGNPYRLPN